MLERNIFDKVKGNCVGVFILLKYWENTEG